MYDHNVYNREPHDLWTALTIGYVCRVFPVGIDRKIRLHLETIMSMKILSCCSNLSSNNIGANAYTSGNRVLPITRLADRDQIKCRNPSTRHTFT